MRHTPFAQVFRVLLGSAGLVPLSGCLAMQSCPDNGPNPIMSRSESLEADLEGLASALEDGNISTEECFSLCLIWFDERLSCTLTYDEDAYQALREAGAPNEGGEGGAGGASFSPGGSTGTGGSATASALLIQCEATGRTLCEGRRHHSWGARNSVTANDAVGRWLAIAGANEAASVRSFRALAFELRDRGVSSSLRQRLKDAARDEVRHARAMDRLAKKRRAQRPRQLFDATPSRPLLAIALENAKEGCVGETFAGLVAAHQARAARDPDIRQELTQIAEEEARHAELAWELHQELMSLLSEAEQIQLTMALEAEIRALGCASDAQHGSFASMPIEARSELGLPEPPLEAGYRRGLAQALEARMRARSV